MVHRETQESTLPLPNPQEVRYDPLSTHETLALHRITSRIATLLYLHLIHRAGRTRWKVTVKTKTLGIDLGEPGKPVNAPQVSRALNQLAKAGLVIIIERTVPRTYLLPLRTPLATSSDPAPPPELLSQARASANDSVSQARAKHGGALSPAISALLIEQRKEKEIQSEDEMNTPTALVKSKPVEITQQRARNVGTYWVEMILNSRPSWAPGYRTAATKEQAIRNATNLLMRTDKDGKPEVDPFELNDIVEWACEHYFPFNDYPYKVTNVFGQLGHWRDLRQKMLDHQAAANLPDEGNGFTNL